MTWFVVDDGFWGHPKVTELSGEAIALWVQAGSWCCRYLTDGKMPLDIARKLGRKQRAVNELLSANLWETDHESLVFHDWSDYQDTRETVVARRKQAAERKQKSRMSREPAAVSHAGVTAESRVAAVLSLPNPSQPNLKASALPHEPDCDGKPSKRDECKLLFAATWKAEAKAQGFESTPDCPAKQRDKAIRMATEAADATGRSFADCLRARIAGGLEASVRLGKAPKWAVVDWDGKTASRGPQAVKDAGERYADLKAALSRLEGDLTHAKVFGTPQKEREIAARMDEIRSHMRAVREAG